MTFFQIIKKLIFIKIDFFMPKQKKVLIYDDQTNFTGYSQIFFKEKEIATFYNRFERINLSILIKTFFEFNIFNFKQEYKRNFLKSVKPKIVYTSINNNPAFYKLKKMYPNAIYISDQNGMMNDNFYNYAKNEINKKKKSYYCDYYFVFGSNDKKKLKKIIKGNIIVAGNSKNNHRKFFIKKKKNKVVFISSKLRINLQEIDKLKIIYNYCYKNNLKLFFIDRPHQNNFKYIVKNIPNIKFTYFSGKNFGKKEDDKKYHHLASAGLIIFAHSTLGYEFLSRSSRIVSYNHTKYQPNFNKNYPNSGPFWYCGNNPKKLEKIIYKVLSYKNKDWNKVAKYYSSKIMFYDKKNSIRKKIIRKCLTKGN